MIITNMPIAQFLIRHFHCMCLKNNCSNNCDISINTGSIKNTGLFRAANPHNNPEIIVPQNELVLEVERYEIKIRGTNRLAAFSVRSMFE